MPGVAASETGTAQTEPRGEKSRGMWSAPGPGHSLTGRAEVSWNAPPERVTDPATIKVRKMTYPRLLGFLFGDGYCYRHKSGAYVVAFEQKLNAKKIIRNYKKKLEEITSLLEGDARKVFIKRKGEKAEIYVYSKKLYREVKMIKQHPVEVFRKMKTQEKIEFITGIIDADGTVIQNEIAIYNSNRELLSHIKAFLQTIGIHASFSKNRHIWRLRIRSKKSIEKCRRLFSSSLKVAGVEPRRRSPEGRFPGSRVRVLGYARGRWGISTPKAKYSGSPIADQYREGKLKRRGDTQ